MDSPHADEQRQAATTGALHTAARTGDQEHSSHHAGVVAGPLPLITHVPHKHLCILRP